MLKGPWESELNGSSAILLDGCGGGLPHRGDRCLPWAWRCVRTDGAGDPRGRGAGKAPGAMGDKTHGGLRPSLGHQHVPGAQDETREQWPCLEGFPLDQGRWGNTGRPPPMPGCRNRRSGGQRTVSCRPKWLPRGGLLGGFPAEGTPSRPTCSSGAAPSWGCGLRGSRAEYGEAGARAGRGGRPVTLGPGGSPQEQCSQQGSEPTQLPQDWGA